MKKAILILLLIATSLIIVSEGVSCSSRASQETVPPEMNGNSTPPEIGKQAPNFTVTNLGGKTKALSDFSGSKVLLNFWSVECAQCAMEMDLLVTVHSQYPDIQIMMIDSKDDTGTVLWFVRNSNFALPVYMDEKRIAANAYDVHLIPKSFLIDSNGIIKYIQDGAFVDQTQLEDALRSLQ
jgi:peroxiredoxin